MRKQLLGSGPLVLVALAFGVVAIATSQAVPARGDNEHEGANLGPGCAPDRLAGNISSCDLRLATRVQPKKSNE